MRTSRRSARALTALTALMLSACGSGTQGPPGYAPPLAANLIVVSIDTVRADHVSCYGYGRPTTPAIDRLASEGVRFEQAFTVMPTTLPAHASMFTSQYPRQTGVQSNLGTLPAGESTLAERLGDAGFTTAAFVSAKVLKRETGFDQGFDTFECTDSRVWEADHMRKLAREWIAENKDERFFAFVHMYDPHAAYHAPERKRVDFGVQSTEPLPPISQLAFMAEPEGLTAELRADAIRAYDAELSFADEQLGLLLDDLRLLELLERTVVVVLSDHGETFDELADEYGYAFDHGEFLYPRELRIPLVVRAPEAFGFAAGGVAKSAVSVLDLMPTALDLMGLACEPPYEGRSLVPLLSGGELADATIVSERHSYVEPPNEWMRGDERALIEYPWCYLSSDGRGDEVFRLDGPAREDDDPGVQRLEARLERWLETRRPKDTRLAPAELGSERDRELKELGYANGG